MATVTMHTLHAIRSHLKGTITRLLTYAEEISVNEHSELIEIKSEKLSETWDEFIKTQNDMYAFQLDPDYVDPDIDFASYETKYLKARGLMLVAIRARTTVSQPVTVPASGNDNSAEAINRLAEQQASFLQQLSSTPFPRSNSTVVKECELPNIVIPSFTGSYKDWPSFKDLFQSSIDSKTHLTDAQKFHYLKSFLRDEAANLVAHISVCDQNYNQAWERLQTRYDRPMQIVNSFIQIFMNLPSCNATDVGILRKISDGADEVVRGLDAMERSERDSWLIFLLLNKVDPDTRHSWAESSVATKSPTIKEFLSFLNTRCEALELSFNNNRSSHKKSQQSARTFVAKFLDNAGHNPSKCIKCSNEHLLFQCDKFRAMDLSSRRQYVKQHGLCFNCLRKGHSSKQCKSSHRCNECGNRHHSLVHSDSSSSHSNSLSLHASQPSSTNSSSPHSSSTHSSSPHSSSTHSSSPHSSAPHSSSYYSSSPSSSSQQPSISPTHTFSVNVATHLNHSLAFIPTAVVDVLDVQGHPQPCRLILDSGSQISFISEDCIRRLRLRRKSANLSISGISSSDGGTTRGCCSLQIRSRVSSDSIKVIAYILPTLTSCLPARSLDDPTLNNVKSLTLADPSLDTTSAIDILLGADQFWNVLTSDRLIGEDGHPIAQSSIFGWIVVGSKPTHLGPISSFNSMININNTLRLFWELEEASVPTKKASDVDNIVEAHFQSTVSRCSDGKYCVYLPFKDDEPVFGNTYKAALNRLLSVERRFAKDPSLRDQYIQFMREYLQLGHMKEVPSTDVNPSSGSLFYLPHHPVVGKKLRVVFDGSCHDSSGRSLNDLLHIGPSIQRNLVSVCLRFRLHRFVFSADIVKMFRQIWVTESHRRYQRILWRESPKDAVKHFELCTVTYGTSCAPFLSVRVLEQLASDYAHEAPVASNIILNDFYVDDVLTGADTESELIKKKNKLIWLLSLGGLELSKWISNSSLLHSMASGEIDMTSLFDGDTTSVAKVLGIYWNPCDDNLLFRVTLGDIKRATKRQLLSDVARIFDPLGLLAPVVISFKIFFQQLWLQNLSWDADLPKHLSDKWLKFRNDMHALNNLAIPRYIPNSTTALELHGFSDASLKAYAAVIFCRHREGDGGYRVTLMSAKTRVAPLKQISLPRLELCGALLLARLMVSVTSALQIPDIKLHAWCDSSIVLAWLSSPPSHLKTFVGNRTAEILDILPRHVWRHVPSKENPADCASRGLLASDLLTFHLWWRGPTWLSRDLEIRESDLSDPSQIPEVLLETRITSFPVQSIHNGYVEHFVHRLANRVSSWRKLVRVVAYVHRFVTNCNAAINGRAGGALSFIELDEGRHICLRFAQLLFTQNQNSRFTSEFIRNPTLKSLSPFLDKRGLLRVGGRIKHSHVDFGAQHPVILPKQSPIKKLIIVNEHIRNLHPGVDSLFVILRQTYWILGCRNLVRKLTHDCLKCFRQRRHTSQQFMANLPSARVTQSYPFENTGCDYAGPITLKLYPGRNPRKTKGYICLFVCLATKAIHLELASDLSTEGFLAAFRRFVARRGKCSNVYSDNGTNFKGAARTLSEMQQLAMSRERNEHIGQSLANDGIRWHFIPPSAPHFGGIWESGVRSVKLHLRRVIGSSILTLEQMHTLLTQIEAVINSRPLCALSDSELNYLTPSHFLIGRPYTALPEGNMLAVPINRLTYWENTQNMFQGFWKRWHREYLTSLQQRPKWIQPERNYKVDDIVVIKSDNCPPAKWQLGRVIQVHPGDDNKVRVVTLRTSNGTFTRLITKIALLPTC